jgi:hypothetical protein
MPEALAVSQKSLRCLDFVIGHAVLGHSLPQYPQMVAAFLEQDGLGLKPSHAGTHCFREEGQPHKGPGRSGFVVRSWLDNRQCRHV